MSLTTQLLPLLKQQVNAVEFDGDDQLLERNLRRALRQLLSVCNRTIGELTAIAAEDEDESDSGLPSDFEGAVLELAAAMYRYGEAYADTSFRFTPSFEMVMSRYRRHYDPFEEDKNEEDEGA